MKIMFKDQTTVWRKIKKNMEHTLREDLKNYSGEDASKEEIQLIIRHITMCILQIKIFQHEREISFPTVLTDTSEFGKTEQFVRKKFHVPDSIPKYYK